MITEKIVKLAIAFSSGMSDKLLGFSHFVVIAPLIVVVANFAVVDLVSDAFT